MPGSAMATQDIAGAAESGTYARVEIGTLHLAVNTRHVVQAIPRPAQLTLLPRGKGALAGVFSHRGQVVPLVSLDRWLHGPFGVITITGGDTTHVDLPLFDQCPWYSTPCVHYNGPLPP